MYLSPLKTQFASVLGQEDVKFKFLFYSICLPGQITEFAFLSLHWFVNASPAHVLMLLCNYAIGPTN